MLADKPKCEHLHVKVYYEVVARATQWEPEETEDVSASCLDCHTVLDLDEVPEDAVIEYARNFKLPKGRPHEHYD